MTDSLLSAERSYRIVNLLLAGIIILIFFYSLLFSPTGGKHPVPSIYTELTGKKSPSTGLSRSFSSIIRGNFSLAREFNPNGIPIFLFFLVQLIFRVVSVALAKNKFINITSYIYTDIILSTVSFFLVFNPLIIFTFKLFRATIV